MHAGSGQFWAFAHYTHAMQRNAVVIGSEGDVTNVQHVAVVNPDGQYAVVLTIPQNPDHGAIA